MDARLKIKKSSVASKVPTTADLEFGELAVNYNDMKLYTKKSNNTIEELCCNGKIIEETGQATYTPDLAKANYFEYTLTEDSTLLKPADGKKGDTGEIVIIQDGTGGHTFALGAEYNMGANSLGLQNPSLSQINIPEIGSKPDAISVFEYTVYDSDKIFLSFTGEL